MKHALFLVPSSCFFFLLCLFLSGCGVKLIRERPPQTKSQPMMIPLSAEGTEADGTAPYGAHLMGKSGQEIVSLLGPPAKKHKGIEKGNEEWYYSHPRKAKLYFKNGKVTWWSLTEEREEKTADGKKKREEDGKKHPRMFPHENIR